MRRDRVRVGCRLAAVALGAVCFIGRTASALPPALHVAGESACPAPGELAAALGRVLPRVPATADVPPAGAVSVRITDGGERYRVQVGEVAREVVDAGRRCDERARAAAVIVALIVDPPQIALPEPDPAPPLARPPPAPPPPPTVPARRPAADRLRVDLEIAARLDGAPRTSPDESLVTGGGALRLSAGGTRFGAALSLAALAPTRIDSASDTTVSLLRVPIDLVLTVAGRAGSRVDVGGEIGLATAVLRARAGTFESRRLEEGEPATRLEVGLRAGARVAIWWTDRLATALAAHAAWFPRPYDLAAPSPIATTPALWLGATLGLVVRLR